MRVARLAAVLLILGAASAVAVRVSTIIDRHLVYFPERELTASPADVGLEFEDVFLTASDGTGLHGWYVPGDGPATLVWFHGNAGQYQPPGREPLAAKPASGRQRVHLRLPGVRPQVTASRRRVACTWTPRPPSSTWSMTVGWCPRPTWLCSGAPWGPPSPSRWRRATLPVRWCWSRGSHRSAQWSAERTPFCPPVCLSDWLRRDFDSLSKMRSVRAPVMVLHGDRDPTVPFEHGQELFEAANDPKRFYRIQGAAHNDTYQVGGEPYFEALREFVDAY